LRIAWTAADGVGARESLEMGGEKKPLKGNSGKRSRWRSASLAARLRTAWVQGWLEMVREKKPLVMSELGCADGCRREMGAENCADGCGRGGCKGGWKWLGRRSRW